MAIRFCETDINLKGICAVEAAPGVVFSVLAIPVIDTLRLFASRWMRGKSPFAPDKRHLHHKLLTIYNGVHKKATFTILARRKSTGISEKILRNIHSPIISEENLQILQACI